MHLPVYPEQRPGAELAAGLVEEAQAAHQRHQEHLAARQVPSGVACHVGRADAACLHYE